MIFFGRDFLFLSRGWIALPPCGHTAELLMQLAVVLRQSSRVRSGCHDVPHRRFCQIHRSWFPVCGCSAYGISASPSRQAGRAYTGSAKYVERQIHDRIAFSFVLLTKGITWATIPIVDWVIGEYELAKLQFRPGCNRDLPELPKIDAPPYPKVAQFFRSCHNAGGSSSGPSESLLVCPENA